MAPQNPESVPPADDWRKRHAFGLPSGSVRALLAILIFGTIWGELLLNPTKAIPDFLGDLLFIIMGHYFAIRRKSAQEPEPGPPPLYLPNGSVRLLFILGSATVALLLYRRGQLASLDRNPAALTLLLIGGFLLGVVVNAISVWWIDKGHQPHRIVEDSRALVSLAAAVLLILLVVNRLFPYIPPDQIDTDVRKWLPLGQFGLEHVLAAVVGFYFGSRS
jgi:hypothetical protein